MKYYLFLPLPHMFNMSVEVDFVSLILGHMTTLKSSILTLARIIETYKTMSIDLIIQ